MRLLSLSFAILALVASASAQTKFDSYGRLTTDDESARLDNFYNQLLAHPELRGYLIGYNEPSVEPGVFLRRIHGDHAYLTELRGLAPGRVSVINGGYRDQFTIELWVAPNDAPAPVSSSTINHQIAAARRYRFDYICLDCSPAVFLDLPGLGSGLKFYAAALRDNPATHASIVLRPGPGTPRGYLLDTAAFLRRRLTRDHGIAADRIRIRLSKRRNDLAVTAELWIVPG